MAHDLVAKDGFRLRGVALSRVDGFSDVVFGFALTLLVVSLEVPKTFDELQAMLSGFVPFALSFLFLMLIWFAHYQFFRRYGLHDLGTIVLNATLLFVVLFYVYPLKFLFTLFVTNAETVRITPAQTPELMLLYGIGFAAIYLLLSAMYWNAWRQRRALELNALERMLTKGYVVDCLLQAAVGILACVLAVVLPVRLAGGSGFVYFLIGLTKTGMGMWMGRKTRELGAATRPPGLRSEAQ